MEEKEWEENAMAYPTRRFEWKEGRMNWNRRQQCCVPGVWTSKIVLRNGKNEQAKANEHPCTLFFALFSCVIPLNEVFWVFFFPLHEKEGTRFSPRLLLVTVTILLFQQPKGTDPFSIQWFLSSIAVVPSSLNCWRSRSLLSVSSYFLIHCITPLCFLCFL